MRQILAALIAATVLASAMASDAQGSTGPAIQNAAPSREERCITSRPR